MFLPSPIVTTPVRPPILPTAAPGPAVARPDAAKLAAQRAFFDRALGKASAPTAALPGSGATAAAAPAASTDASAAEPPQKILRPGSLIDIRV